MAPLSESGGTIKGIGQAKRFRMGSTVKDDDAIDACSL